jgi:hypothetical protein
MGSFLELVERLIGEPTEKMAYAADPQRYLAAHGFGAFGPVDVETALRHAAHAFPPVLAAHVSPLDGLAHLAEVHLHELSLHSVTDYRLPADHPSLGEHDAHGGDHGASATVGADLHSLDLHPTDLHPTDLHPTDLHPTDLHHADLHHADLHPVDLHHADHLPGGHVAVGPWGHGDAAVPTHAELSRDVGLDRSHGQDDGRGRGDGHDHDRHPATPGDHAAHAVVDGGHEPTFVSLHDATSGHEQWTEHAHDLPGAAEHDTGNADHGHAGHMPAPLADVFGWHGPDGDAPGHDAEHGWVQHWSDDPAHVSGDHALASHEPPLHDASLVDPHDHDHHVDGDLHHL